MYVCMHVYIYIREYTFQKRVLPLLSIVRRRTHVWEIEIFLVVGVHAFTAEHMCIHTPLLLL
jgi:hypothetical protein